jgi:hypothetical protein
VTINKSISLTGVVGAGIDTNGGTAVTILNGPEVHLDHLIFQNVSGARSGTGVNAGGGLQITHCTVKGYGIGIMLAFSIFQIADTLITENDTGISAGPSTGLLDHVVLFLNKIGTVVSGAGTTVDVVDTIASNNGVGFSVSTFRTSAAFTFAHSTIERNTTGIDLAGHGTATSFGDNHIKFNGTDVSGGTLTNVGTQ